MDLLLETVLSTESEQASEMSMVLIVGMGYWVEDALSDIRI